MNLHNNQIRNVSEVDKFKSLKFLNFSYNQINDMSDSKFSKNLK
ncbi:leucine-rich repeat domain-containing protein [Chryseobacterium piscicola]